MKLSRSVIYDFFRARTLLVFAGLILSSCDAGRSQKSDGEIIVSLLSDSIGPGCCGLAWTQVDDSQQAVEPGKFRARFITAEYDTVVEFEIRENVSSVPFPFTETGCWNFDDPNSSVTCRFPDRFLLSVQSPMYARGDTVAIGVTTPKGAEVWIGIER